MTDEVKIPTVEDTAAGLDLTSGPTFKDVQSPVESDQLSTQAEISAIAGADRRAAKSTWSWATDMGRETLTGHIFSNLGANRFEPDATFTADHFKMKLNEVSKFLPEDYWHS